MITPQQRTAALEVLLMWAASKLENHTAIDMLAAILQSAPTPAPQDVDRKKEVVDHLRMLMRIAATCGIEMAEAQLEGAFLTLRAVYAGIPIFPEEQEDTQALKDEIATLRQQIADRDKALGPIDDHAEEDMWRDIATWFPERKVYAMLLHNLPKFLERRRAALAQKAEPTIQQQIEEIDVWLAEEQHRSWVPWLQPIIADQKRRRADLVARQAKERTKD